MISRGKAANPWARGKEYEFEDELLDLVAERAIAAADKRTAEDPKPDVSYAYDKCVLEAIKGWGPNEDDERYAFMRALKETLQSKMDWDNWYDGASAAQRVISSHCAWATPGFGEARRMSDYGN